jgi:hypothetical protein
MALITDPDVYSLKLNSDGFYEDDIPSTGYFSNDKQLKCLCNNNQFRSRVNFVSHTKTGIHKNWIETQNANRNNHSAELEEEKKNNREQKIRIAQMQREITQLQYEKRELLRTIRFLSDNIINRLPDVVAPQQEEMADLMNFE